MQCLLHRREPDTLGEFTFPAYDPLLSLLNTSVSENLAGEHVMLCLELMWLTLNACPGNAPFLGDKGAVPVLVNLLMAARQQMAQDTVAHVDHAVIVTLSLRALALVLGSEETRREVVMMPDDDRTEFLKVCGGYLFYLLPGQLCEFWGDVEGDVRAGAVLVCELAARDECGRGGAGRVDGVRRGACAAGAATGDGSACYCVHTHAPVRLFPHTCSC